jgi:hypothetical protein
MSSGVDMLTLILVLIQVPADVYFTSNGIRTYWKRIDKSIPEATEDNTIEGSEGVVIEIL